MSSRAINRKLNRVYKKTAKHYGTSVEDVKQSMQEAINAAYVNPTLTAMYVPCKGKIPTADEFIVHEAKRTRVLLSNQDGRG